MDCLADYVTNSPGLLALLPRCSNASTQNKFVELASAFLQAQQISHNPDELFSHFTSFMSSDPKANTSHSSITAALFQFREHRKEKRAFKNRLITDLSLRLTTEQCNAKLASIPVYYVDRLATPYPPLNTWVYEVDAIGEQWRHQLEHGKQVDTRQRRKPLVKLDFSKLQHNVDATSDAIFRDNKTGEIIGLVIRNFIGREDILQWAGKIIDDSIGMKKSV